MLVSELIKKLQGQMQTMGDLPVMYRHVSTDICGEVIEVDFSDRHDSTGPYSLKPDEDYFQILVSY